MGHSTGVPNPSGGAQGGRVPVQPALGLDLMRDVLASTNVGAVWEQVRRNKGAPGVDGMSVTDFPDFVRANWPDIKRALMDGTYRPQPVRQKAIPKPNGGVRLLGIPTVLDRVIQQAIAQVLGPIFDPLFSESSFGFRPGRSAHGAVKQVQRNIGEGYRVAVDLDLAKFFDRVDHDVLMARVGRRVIDRPVLRLIGLYLRAGVVVDGKLQPTTQGVPQGGPLSPLLSNIVLDDFDKELERRGHRFSRYADDVLIVVRSLTAGRRVMASVTRWLGKVLELEVNADKSQVVATNQATFLGFQFRGTRIWCADKTWTRFKAEVRRLTNRNWGVSMSRRFGELASYLRGWMGYFGLSSHYQPTVELDKWIRRRVRMCYWVQWRWTKTRIRRLLALRVPRDWAVRTGMSSKGPWHMSRNQTINAALSKAFLTQQGLLSIRELWIQAAPLRRTA